AVVGREVALPVDTLQPDGTVLGVRDDVAGEIAAGDAAIPGPQLHLAVDVVDADAAVAGADDQVAAGGNGDDQLRRARDAVPANLVGLPVGHVLLARLDVNDVALLVGEDLDGLGRGLVTTALLDFDRDLVAVPAADDDGPCQGGALDRGSPPGGDPLP